MPHIPFIKSAKKRIKVSEKKALQNKMIKSGLKSTLKSFEAAVEAGNGNEANSLFKKAASSLDKAATKGTIHKNAANRKKAQLAQHLKKVSAAQ